METSRTTKKPEPLAFVVLKKGSQSIEQHYCRSAGKNLERFTCDGMEQNPNKIQHGCPKDQ